MFGKKSAQKDRPRTGDRVLTSDGREIGRVRWLGKRRMHVARARIWLPQEAITRREEGRTVRLDSEYDFLGEVEDPKATRKRGMKLAPLGLLALAGGAAMALRNQERRRKLSQAIGSSKDKLESLRPGNGSTSQGSAAPPTAYQDARAAAGATGTEPQAQGGSSAGGPPTTTPSVPPPAGGASQERASSGAGQLSSRFSSERASPTGPAGSNESSGASGSSQSSSQSRSQSEGTTRGGEELPEFSSLDLSNRTVSELETQVIALVTEAFPRRMLRVDAVGVHKLEGGEVGTLRFTLDEQASSDLELAQLENSQQAAQPLADRVIEDLRQQLPAEQE